MSSQPSPYWPFIKTVGKTACLAGAIPLVGVAIDGLINLQDDLSKKHIARGKLGKRGSDSHSETFCRHPAGSQIPPGKIDPGRPADS